MNKNQKRLLLACLCLFWFSVIYLPACDSVLGQACNIFDSYEFIWNYFVVGVYLPMLLIEWFAIAVSFVALFYFFKDE
jgi:hypothetical protein